MKSCRAFFMLSINELHMEFGGVPLFSNISFNMSPGERLGLIGKNGAGKSTLLKIISGNITPDKGNISHPKDYRIGYLPQEVIIHSENTVFVESKSALEELNEMDKRIKFIEEALSTREDYESEEYKDLINEITFLSEKFDRAGGNALEAKISRILTGLGFKNEDLYKHVSELSGGWQMRVELAKILLSEPDCILLDEPTNHLDIESVLWLEDFLKNYYGAILVISHDRRFLDNVTNRTVELTFGKTFDLKHSYSKYMEQREEIIRVQKAAKKNQDKQIAEIENFVTKFRAKARQASRAQSKLKQLDKIDRIKIDEVDHSSINFFFPPSPRSGRLVVECEGLSKSYEDNQVLREIDFVLERGEKVAFVGRNGEGKSTLSKIIAGIESHEGQAHIGSNVLVGYFAQHQAKLLEGNQTVFEVIDNAAKGDMRTQIRNLLGAFLFSGDDIYKKVSVLSGGEKSRLALCKLLLQPSNLLIMDEPTNHLDMSSKDVLKNALNNYEGAMIIVSHDREFLEGLTSKTIEFKNKKIKEIIGDINDFLDYRKAQSFVDIEKKDKKTSKNEKPKSVKANKELQKITRKLSREIEELESKISELEIGISDLEKEFADPEITKDTEKMILKQKEYDNKKSELDNIMLKWEEKSSELEEFSE